MACFKSFYSSLSSEQKQKFAGKASLSRVYIEKHLLRTTKRPSYSTIVSLSRASDGALTPHDILDYFLTADGVAV